jgi:2-oxo-4-hydroxy-4-carboxy-5-ureidoimidazoline decarboxylase
MPTESPLETLNEAEPEHAERELLACCAARRWADELIVHRPYHDVATLERISDRVFAKLDWTDIEQALAAHPRIGERVTGESREANWSRDEQAEARGDLDLQEELRVANAEYEKRFGHVFLINATGRSAEQILAALRTRLDNDASTERETIREELRQIATLRLRKLVGA